MVIKTIMTIIFQQGSRKGRLAVSLGLRRYRYVGLLDEGLPPVGWA